MKKKFTFLIAALMLLTMMVLPGKVVGQTYQELYSADFTSVSNHGYTQNKTFTINSKIWTASVSQVASNVFYLGTNTNSSNLPKGILGNNNTFTNEDNALSSVDGQYTSGTNHAYALKFENAYNDVTKIRLDWAGCNGVCQVYLFGDSGDGYVQLQHAETVNNTSTSGYIEWTGTATSFTKFAIVVRPGSSNTNTTGKTLRATTFTIYKTQASSVTAPTINPTAVNSFEDELEVSLTFAQGTTAYYNINSNTDPTSESTPYTAPFNISASSTIKAIAYDGNSNPSSVVSKEYTKEEFTNIEDVNTDKAYKVRGTVVATNTRGFMLADNTGYVYVYLYDKNNNSNPTLPSVNDKRKVNGTPGTYGKVIEYKYGCTVTEATGTTFTSDTPTDIDGDDMYNVIQDSENNYLSAFEQFEGTLSYSNDKYTISVAGDEHNATAQISYPNSTQTEALNGLVNKTVRVQGYFTGLSSGNYTVMLGSIVEVVNPTITADPTSLTFTYVSGGSATSKTLTIEGGNLSEGITATITTGDDKFSISADEETWENSLVLSAAGDLIAVRLNSGITTTGTYDGVITLSSGGAESVTVTLTGTVTTPTHNIALYPTPSGHGTITLPETTIIPEGSTVTLSAEPADGYDFGSWKLYKKVDAEYELINNITVSNNQFTMPTYDVWVDATFTAKQTYAISTSVAPANSGTIEIDTYAWAGKNVIVLVEAESGYAFSSIAVTKTSDSSTEIPTSGNATDGFTFEMPAYPVTVTATFVEVLDITFTVNGTQKTVKHINQGSQIGELPVLADSEIPSGLAFKGWTSSTDYFDATTPAATITEETVPASSTTYAALFCVSTPGVSHWTLTSDAPAAGDDVILAVLDGTTYYALFATTGSLTRTSFSVSNNNITGDIPSSWEVVNASYTSGNVTYTGLGLFSGSYQTVQNEDKELYLHINSSAGKIATTFQNGVFDFDASGSGYTLTSKVNSRYLKYASNAFGVSSSSSDLCTLYVFKKVTEPGPESNYTTIVTDENISGEVSDLRIFESISATDDVTNSGTIHIFNGGVLDMGTYQLTNETPANLIIEDGGQLICSNSVAATVKKSIANANAKDPKDHWYTISAPVHTGSNNYVTIGASTTVNLTNNGAYDMFAYDEPTHYWLNQKEGNEASGFTAMNVGQGYLYRNSGNELSFVGNANFGEVTVYLSCSSGVLTGFNLIGNPYTHSIAKGSGKAIVNVVNENTVLSNGCYVLSNSGTWTIIEDGNEIKPNQGILVEAKGEVTGFIIKDINYVAPGKYNNDNLKFSVENAEYSDAAYAWFDKGIGLTKINHRNDRAPMLYIPQDGHNYAIAIMSDDTKVFGLNFKAATMGQYTLSYKATGEYNYIHVIDRFTGEDVDMLLDDKYTFVAMPNDQENRFIVKLGYTPDYSEGDNDIFAYQTGSEILVSGLGELQIFDVTGRKVMTTTINGAESITVPAQGVYIFRLVGNEIKTQKIVVR